MKRRIKLRKFSALSIGLSAACLALACGSDNQEPSETEVDPQGGSGGGGVVDECENPYLEGCPLFGSEPGEGGAGGDGPVERPPATRTPEELAKDLAQNVLRTNCGGCHGSQLNDRTAEAGMNYIDDMDELASKGKIVPLSAETSPIVIRMRNGTMPPSGAGVTKADIDIVANYIDNEDYWPDAVQVACDDNPAASFDVLYGAVADDLRRQEADDQPFIRYLSVANRAAAGVCTNTSLDLDRQAVTKLVNMLSIDPGVYRPEPVDRDQTLYRIDMRELQWNREITVDGVTFADVWEAIIDANDYAIPFVGDDADNATADAQTAVPVMFLDSMLNDAAIGNLYYAIIDVDVTQNLDTFVSDVLLIDVEANIADEEVVRAGTTESDISRQDRLIEGHEIGSRQGVYYQSFDFAAGQGNDSIFQDPFGFNEGGREAIFTLPNGMLAYLIADADGVLVQDSDILLDSSQDNYRAITSVSCSNCHVDGFIPVEDEVREVVLDNAITFIQDGTLNQEQLEQLQAIYLRPDAFAARLEDDSDQFYRSALRRAELPLNGREPISSAFNRFKLDLTLKTAAADLGVTAEVLSDNIDELDPVLNVLDRATGKLDRDDFTAKYAVSLCTLTAVNRNQVDPVFCAEALAALDD